MTLFQGSFTRAKAEWAAFKPRPRHYAAILFFAVFSVYLNSLDNGFVSFDDTAILHGDSLFLKADPFSRFGKLLFSDPRKALSSVVIGRPLRDLSINLDRAVFGEDPWGYHLSNLLYQSAASVAAYLAADCLLGSSGLALLCALLFTLHPAQTESIAYIGGRRDILSGGLFLFSFYFFAGFWKKRKPGWLWLSLLSWVLAVESKQSAIVLPVLAALYLYLLKPSPEKGAGAIPGRKFLKPLAAAIGAATVLFAAFNIYQHSWTISHLNLSKEVYCYGGTLLSQYLMVPVVFGQAVYKTLFPVVLCGDYSYRAIIPVTSFTDWRFILSVMALAGILTAAFKTAKKEPLVSFSIFSFLITFAPMLPLFPSLHNIEVFAEHWLYLPLFCFALLLTCLLEKLRRKSGALFILCLALLIPGYCARTFSRNRDWKDPRTFWSRTLEQSPDCIRALSNMSIIYGQEKDLAGAGALLDRALAISPLYVPALLNKSVLYENAGNYAAAESVLKTALMSPEVVTDRWKLYYRLGTHYAKTGKVQQAIEILKKTQDNAVGAVYAPGLDMLGCMYFASGDLSAAELYLTKALIVNPAYSPAARNLGTVYFTQGRYAEAVTRYETALDGNPKDLQALINLSVSQSFLSRPLQAYKNVAQALRLAPNSTEALSAASLVYRREKRFRAAQIYAAKAMGAPQKTAGVFFEAAMVFKENGEVGKALENFEKALKLAPARPDIRLFYADTLMAAGDKVRAFAELDRILAQYPDYAPALNVRNAIRQRRESGR